MRAPKFFIPLFMASFFSLPILAQEEAEAPPPPEEKGTEVVLDPSFQLDQEEGKKVTHMPAVAFTQDRKRLVTGTSGGEVIVWSNETRAILRRFSFSDKPVVALAMDPEGTRVIALFEDRRLISVDVEKGEIEAEAVLDGALELGTREAKPALVVSPDAETVIVSIAKGFEIRRARDLEILARKADAHENLVSNLAISPDGTHLATVGLDGRVRVWARGDLSLVRTMEKGQPLFAVCFSPDGSRVAYGGQANRIEDLVLATGEERLIASEQPFWITVLGYSPDGRTIASGDESCDVWLLDVEAANHRLFHSKHHVECWLSSVTWARDGETFLFGCRPNAHAGVPQIFNSNTQEEAHFFDDVRALKAGQSDLQAACYGAWKKNGSEETRGRLRSLLEAKAKLLKVNPDGTVLDAAEQTFVMHGSANTTFGPAPAAVVPGDQGQEVVLGTIVLAGGEAQIEVPLNGNIFEQNLNQKQGYAGPSLTEEERKSLEAIDKELAAIHTEIAADPELRDAQKQLEENTKQYVETFQKRCEELNGKFCINQWRVKR